jgi:hypothetical protein
MVFPGWVAIEDLLLCRVQSVVGIVQGGINSSKQTRALFNVPS